MGIRSGATHKRKIAKSKKRNIRQLDHWKKAAAKAPCHHDYIYWVEVGTDLYSRKFIPAPFRNRPAFAKQGRWVACPDLRVGDVLLNPNQSRALIVEAPSNSNHLPRTMPISLKQMLDIIERELTIRSTKDHPFYVKGKGWVPANELKPDDLLRTNNDSWVSVVGIEDKDESEPVFNIQVTGAHTYFVGVPNTVTAILVHNASLVDVVRKAFAKWQLPRGRDSVLSEGELSAVIRDPNTKGEEAVAAAFLLAAFEQIAPLHNDKVGHVKSRAGVPGTEGISLDDIAELEKNTNMKLNCELEFTRSLARLNVVLGPRMTVDEKRFDETNWDKWEEINQNFAGTCPDVAAYIALVKQGRAKEVTATWGVDGDGMDEITVNFKGAGKIKISPPTQGEIAYYANGGDGGLGVSIIEKAYVKLLADKGLSDVLGSERRLLEGEKSQG